MRTANAERSYEIESLHERHKEIIRLVTMGLTNTQIAKELGCSPAMVVYTKYSEVGQRLLQELGFQRSESVKDIQKRIEQIAPHALDTLEALMTSEETPEAVRARIAMDNLDRAGLAPKSRSGGSYLDEKDIERIKEQARQNGLFVEAKEAEPVEYKEVSQSD